MPPPMPGPFGFPSRARSLAALGTALLFLAACSDEDFGGVTQRQFSVGIIQGFVRDIDLPGTPVLPGITVSMTPSVQNTVTDSIGFYQFRDVPVGTYKVTALRPGNPVNHVAANAVIQGGDVFQANLDFGAGPGVASSRQVMFLSSNGIGSIFFSSQTGTDQSSITPGGIAPPIVKARFNRAVPTEVVVEAAPGGNSGIFLADLAGGSATTVIQTASPETHPDLSPDGNRVVYAADTDLDGNFEIWLIQRDGTAPTLLVDDFVPAGGARFDSRDPAWSPDGVTILFARRRTDVAAPIDQRDYEIVSVRVDGGPIVVLTQDLLDDREPTWHPDSTTIFYAKQASGFFQLFVATAQQFTAEVQLTANFVDDREPTVSLDGTLLGWTTRDNPGGQNPEGNRELVVAQIVGTTLVSPFAVTRTPGSVTISSPDFRPHIP